MTNENNRWVYFYDLVVTPTPDPAPNIPMEEICWKFKELYDADIARKPFRKNRVAMRIGDISIDTDKRVAHVLLRYADKDLTDPAFDDFNTGDLRVEKKRAAEGIGFSAHLSIKLDGVVCYEDGIEMVKYPALLERVPGVVPSIITAFFRALIHDFCDQEGLSFEDPNTRTFKKYRALIAFEGHISTSLEDDLRGGKIGGIELVKHKNVDLGMDEDSYFAVDSQSLRLSVLEGRPVFQSLNKLKTVMARKGYDQYRIRYVNSAGKSRTVDVDQNLEKIEDTALVKYELFESAEKLDQCSEGLRPDLTNYMTNILAPAEEIDNGNESDID